MAFLPNGLTEKEEAFCQYYLFGPETQYNGSKRAIKAGYTKKNARDIACKKLTKSDKVKARIAQLQAEAAVRQQVTVDTIFKELAVLGLSDMADFADWDGESLIPKDSKTLKPGLTKAVSEVTQTAGKFGNSIKLKLHDKKAALEMLGRHLGMWQEKDQANVVILNASPVDQVPVGGMSLGDQGRLLPPIEEIPEKPEVSQKAQKQAQSVTNEHPPEPSDEL